MTNSRPGQKIKMTSIDELLCVPDSFGTTEIVIRDIYPFENHPFKVLDDEKMDELVDQKRIPISVAVEMSFFTRQIQQWIHEYCIDVRIPKWNELADLRSGVPQKDITKENLYEYLNGKKNVPDAPEKIIFTRRKLNQYFPKYISTPERERIIISLLEKWKEEQENKVRQTIH